MTQLALLKRKINFASDKQIGHVIIICSYIDKEREHLELNHAGIPHSPSPLQPPKATNVLWMGYWNLSFWVPDVTLISKFPPSLRLPGREHERYQCLDFP